MSARIAVVDDHIIVLDALVRLLSAEPGWTVVAGCRDAAEALDVVRGEPLDLLVLDLTMPGMTGVELARRVADLRPGLALVVVTAGVGADDLALLLAAGIRGIVLKGSAPAAIVACVRTVLAGGTWLKLATLPAARDRLAARSVERTRVTGALTAREFEVARLAADGWQTKDIGAKLQIAAGTVKLHLHNIYAKLDVTTRIELANTMRAATL